MSLLSLGAMIFWGMLLCFGYQLFLPLGEKVTTLWKSILLYSGAGLLCFLLTAMFLYAINGGEWGLYGFLALVLGFGGYHRLFRIGGRRLAARMVQRGEKVCRCGFRMGQRLSAGVALPFGKLVDKGVLWAEKAERKREKEEKAKGHHGGPS